MWKLSKRTVFLLALALGVAEARFISPRLGVVQSCQPKVVKIGVIPYVGRGHFIGSGAIVSSDGSILTCAHLVGMPGKIFVKTASRSEEHTSELQSRFG